MAEYTVVTPFNTQSRRFSVGQPITEDDLDGTLTLADRIRLGQIAAPPAAKPGKAKDAVPAPDQAEPPVT